MSKRFLHIGLTESWGGLEMAVVKWNQVLSEQGHSNVNICTPQSPLAEELKEQGQIIDFVSGEPRVFPGGPGHPEF